MKTISVLFCSVLLHSAASAQKLPPTSRTVYKCEEAGKVHYSDAPCLGAQKIDVEPTRGLNKSSGKELIGKDVQREQNREIFADAIRPLTGMDSKQLDKAGRRMRLTPEAQRECQRLDRELPAAELAERQAVAPSGLKTTQERLMSIRTAFRASRCE